MAIRNLLIIGGRGEGEGGGGGRGDLVMVGICIVIAQVIQNIYFAKNKYSVAYNIAL